MTTPTSKPGRAAGLADRIEAAGGAALLALWSLAMWALRLAARVAAALVARAWTAFRRQRRGVQLGLVAAAALLWLTLSALRADREGRVWTDSDTEALARVIRSEAGGASRQERLHVAWATRNLAAERGHSIARMACQPCGRQGRGRPVSSCRPARDADRALARQVLGAPASLDPTGGATHFLNPRLQDRLARSGLFAGYAGQTYGRVRRRWQRSYGWEPYYRLGPELEMWGPRRTARLATLATRR